MSGAKWTDEQLTAITARDCNLLVAAAAGAGKTAVLVERIIRRITDINSPVDVDRMLVVTFTKAAAAEMRERIGAAIARELNRNPGSRHLHRQLTLLNRAAITTLHSFCLEVLRQYFYRLDLDPVFRVADDTEADLLRMEALEEILEGRYTAGDEGFLKLVDAYGGDRDDTKLQELVLKLYEFASSNPWPELWLQTMAENYRPGEHADIDALPWGKSVVEWVELQLQGLRTRLERALKLAAAPGGPEVYLSTLREDSVRVEELLRAASSWTALYKAFAGVQTGNLKPCRDKNVDDNLKERVKKIRDEVKKQVTGLGKEFFSRPPEELLADLRQMAPLLETLAGLVAEFRTSYGRLKRAKGLVDFSDLEHYCLAILLEPGSKPGELVPSPVALELREHFAEVLVDEYQDINAVQETILRLVSRQGSKTPNMFMVGDVKQSIYRFRLAEPALFMEKYSSYPREAGGPNRGVDLARNFRSRREVVDGVNFIFRQLMTTRVGELAYDGQAELVCGAQFLPGIEGMASIAAGPVELHILEKQPGEAVYNDVGSDDLVSGEFNSDEIDSGDLDSGEGDSGELTSGKQGSGQDDPEELDAVQREARLVAARIRKMVNGSEAQPGPEFYVLDKQTGSYRPVRYHDIVILMRATRGMANTYLEEFRQAGIPGYADLGTGYFEATEVETMMSLLKVIDNPRQDIPLAAVLRSAVVGLAGEELAQVRLCAPGGDFYTAACRAAGAGTDAGPGTQAGTEAGADTGTEAGLGTQAGTEDPVGGVPPELALKLAKFLKDLEGWRTMARQGSLAGLVWRLYTDTGFYAYVGAMPGGVQRQANLRALHDRARQYEATSFRGLFRFLRFIEKFQERGSDLGTARALGENEDVVRIMSIHKSKGLEFPVVIVTGMGKQFNLTDLNKTALLHKELGLGLPLVDTELRLTYPSLAQVAIKKRLQMELLAEEMRILYVALTRAKEKLILVGSVQDVRKCAARWCENVNHSPWNLPDPDLAAAKTFLDWVAPAVARHQDGEHLRRLAGLEAVAEGLPTGPVAKDPSRWQVFSRKAEDCRLAAVEAEKGQDGILEKIAAGEPLELTGPDCGQLQLTEHDSQLQLIEQDYAQLHLTEHDYSQLQLKQADRQEQVDRILSWQYPYADLAGKPVKATVTEMKRRFSALEEEAEGIPEEVKTGQSSGVQATARRTRLISRPRFLQGSTGLSPAEKGSAMHLVMQHLNLQGDLSVQGIKQQVARLELAELLTTEQAAALDIAAIAGFFASSLGRRVAGNHAVKRELPFTIALPAQRVYTGLHPGSREQILVQGVIDCLVDEGDGLVLIDYKTDHVRDNGIDHLAENYRGQLNLYAYALEAILKQPVKEKYLYLFATGTAVRI